MDDQGQQPTEQPTRPSADPVTSPNPLPANTSTPIVPLAATDKPPQLEVSDAVAQSLLALNGIQTPPKTKLHLPIAMLLTIAVVIILVIAASFMLGQAKNPPKAPSANTSSGTSSHSSGQSGDQQINQDVNSCSSVVNAVSEC